MRYILAALAVGIGGAALIVGAVLLLTVLYLFVWPVFAWFLGV